ncbi:type VI secretion system ATPase TssH [Photorhabdus khanii]|uniref:Type VI secretion system ATPase TssH n=1 Tax=Photorhabdus khanii subsp. guanajuatensis TaxID=2100166 RepID=A0A4R4JB23_9GAMM|nr:type VI secretion system ATPase TssH [Photorhabdus khanii]TDB51258.1 type VI secretion system ATPase TssH [Photorhabdus khanii subsp. guanajuatensis]
MSSYLKQIVSKLTVEARQCLDEAANLAVRRTHHEVEIEHLLLALFEKQMPMMEQVCHHGGIDAITLLNACQRSLTLLRSGNHRPPVLATNLTEWMEQSWMYASTHWGALQITPQALIAALIMNPSLHYSLTSELQQTLQCNTDAIEQWLRTQVHTEPQHMTAPVGDNTQSALAQYTHHLTQAARDNKLDPVLGREREIRQLIDVLLRRRQNNPLLTGEAGVGKTALIEGLAQRIVDGRVPAVLAQAELFTLDMGLLQAGASVKGEFESRLQKLLDEVKGYPTPVILFIDEAHTLIGAGGQAGQNDAANLLKPALARGELRAIAATTWAEYKKYFEKDAALARRFQVIKVEEPSIELATAMLRAMTPAMEKHHGVNVLAEAVTEAVVLSSRYINGRQLPDKSVSLLDSACARVAVSQTDEPAPIEDLRAMLANIATEQEALLREGGHETQLQKLAQRQTELQVSLEKILPEYHAQRQLVNDILTCEEHDERLAVLRAELRQRHHQHAYVFDCVDAACVADIVAGWTGIPLGRMVENERDVLRQLETRLSQRVMGQDHALSQIARQIRIAKAQMADPVKPTGVFMLAGPSGVGKTETALALAHELYGGEHHLITINMSEYQEAHSVSGLKGSPPGYVGYGQGGVLTEAVRHQPYSVVLLDEVEKAHPDVLELFFQVFDKGMMEDAEGQQINFRNTLIILTTNAASDLVMRAAMQGVKIQGEIHPATLEDIQEIIRPELQRIFTPAFLGRLQVIPYLPVHGEVLHAIVHHKLNKVVMRYRQVTQCELHYSNALVDFIAEGCQIAESGAREIDNLLTRFVLPLLSDQLLLGDAPVNEDVWLDVIEGQIQLS